jgi:hypothetical protein
VANGVKEGKLTPSRKKAMRKCVAINRKTRLEHMVLKVRLSLSEDL